MYEVRLQKFLAECGIGSRRKMEQFIKEGRVRVNGQVVTELGRKINPERDKIEVNRRPVRAAPKGIMLLNKPRGVVSTLSDPEGRPTVAEFLTKHYTSYFPVGRLDYDSTGLMILTNDGEMAERLMHPRFGFERVYEARVEGSVAQVTLDKLRAGVRLSDGFVEADAAVLRSDTNSTWVEVKIKEGRNRVVRRVFEKLGHPVMKLKRTTYGPFKIGRLQVGQVRVLTLKEFLQVRRKVMTFKPDEESAKVDARSKESRPQRSSRDERSSQRGGRSSEPRQRGSERNDSRPSGSRPSSARPGGSRPSSSRPSSPRPSGSRPGGPRRDGSRQGGPRKGGSRQRSGSRRRD